MPSSSIPNDQPDQHSFVMVDGWVKFRPAVRRVNVFFPLAQSKPGGNRSSFSERSSCRMILDFQAQGSSNTLVRVHGAMNLYKS